MIPSRERSLVACIAILLLANVAAIIKAKACAQELGLRHERVSFFGAGILPQGTSASNGEQFSYSFEGAPDGKDYSMKSPNNKAVIGFTRAYRRIGGTLQAVDKRNGQVIQMSTTTVSNDGRTMTILFVRSASDMTWTEVLDHVK